MHTSHFDVLWGVMSQPTSWVSPPPPTSPPPTLPSTFEKRCHAVCCSLSYQFYTWDQDWKLFPVSLLCYSHVTCPRACFTHPHPTKPPPLKILYFLSLVKDLSTTSSFWTISSIFMFYFGSLTPPPAPSHLLPPPPSALTQLKLL